MFIGPPLAGIAAEMPLLQIGVGLAKASPVKRLAITEL